jgi:hypothetical protein
VFFGRSMPTLAGEEGEERAGVVVTASTGAVGLWWGCACAVLKKKGASELTPAASVSPAHLCYCCCCRPVLRQACQGRGHSSVPHCEWSWHRTA